jgi:hypothetical protein
MLLNGRKNMTKSEVVTIRLDSETMEKIRQKAVKSYRSIAKEINYLLEQALKSVQD